MWGTTKLIEDDSLEINENVELQEQGAEVRVAEKEKELRNRKTRQHFNDLVANSTLHGLHFCFDKKHFIRRICWTLLILLAMGLLVQKLYVSTKNYFSYPFSTTTTIMHRDKMIFPAVSFCNLNQLRLSRMKNTKLHKLINEGGEYRITVQRAYHELEHMLQECKIKNSIICTAKNFTEFLNRRGDRCFTFNSGDAGQSPIYVNDAGLSNGLELTIDIQHFDYDLVTAESGIRLILHGQDETPAKMEGLILSPGFKTFIEVKKRKVKNLPAPYKTNCEEIKLKYFKGYSKHLCWLEQLTDYVVKQCGCKDWFMPGQHRVCSLQESVGCMWGNWSNFEKLGMEKCPLPCVIESYVPTLSFAHYPSNQKADSMAKKLKLNGTKPENRKFIRENYLSVVIYYSELSYEYMEQIPSYDSVVLLGDIGGLLCLFLGSSVLTYIEFFDCFAMIIYARFFEVFRRSTANV